MRHRKQQYLSSSLRRALRRWQRRVAAYFQREGRLWLWFGSAMLGVLAKSFFEVLQASQPYGVSWPQIVMALVATLVTFQTTYQRYKDVQASTPLLLQVSIAFGCGFFWQTVFNDLTDAKQQIPRLTIQATRVQIDFGGRPLLLIPSHHSCPASPCRSSADSLPHQLHRPPHHLILPPPCGRMPHGL